MKRPSKSSITLPPNELALVEGLAKRLKAKSKVEVIRRGLYLLRDQTDREALKAAYTRASLQARDSTPAELDDLDHLSGEGLD